MNGRVSRTDSEHGTALCFTLLLMLSCAAVAGGIYLAGFSAGNPFTLWMWLAVAICFYFSWRFRTMRYCPEKFAGLVFGFLLILAQLIGRQFDLHSADGVPFSGGPVRWICCQLCACGLAPALGWPAAGLMKQICRTPRNDPSCPYRSGWAFAGYLAILMLFWLPYHLAYFPALMEYDSGYQLWQSWNHVYNASNPLIHTFILGFFYLTGERIATVTAGLAVLSFLQQLLMASCLAWALTVLRRNGAPRLPAALCLLFFGLLPVFGMMSLSMTKDVPFYCLVLVQLTLIFDGFRRPAFLRSWRYWAVLTAVTVLACLFRANALAAMFLIPPLICLGCRSRSFRERVFCSLMAGTLLACGLNALIVSAVQADSPLLRESLNVPIVQLARTSSLHEDVRDDLTENQENLVSMPLLYIPYVADLAKWNSTPENGAPGSFLKLWARWGSSYPVDYADAALLLNRGYWYLWDWNYAKVYGESYEQHLGVLPSRVSAGIGTIVESCFLPDFYAHMEHMYSENQYLDIPGYRLLFSPAFYVWILLFALACATCRGRQDVRMPARIGCLYLAGLLLGPCCILRYALLFMMLAPLLLCMLAAGDKAPQVPNYRKRWHDKVKKELTKRTENP